MKDGEWLDGFEKRFNEAFDRALPETLEIFDGTIVVDDLGNIVENTVRPIDLEDLAKFVAAVKLLKSRGYTIIPPSGGIPKSNVFSDIVGL